MNNRIRACFITLTALALCTTTIAATPTNIALANADFADGLTGWTLEGPEACFSVVPADDQPMLRLAVQKQKPPGWIQADQDLDVEPGQIIHAEARVQAKNLHDGWGALIAITHYDKDKKRLAQVRSDISGHDGKWETLTANSIVPAQCARTELSLVLHGCGEAYFRDPRVQLLGMNTMPPLKGPVTLTVTSDVVCEHLLGFGAEDDGWFYNQYNRKHGADAEVFTQREQRIEWLDPDWVRMFTWYPEWCPSGDWKTFDFDTDNMKSRYRTLDLYQRIGADVNIVGVSWGVERPLDDPKAFAFAMGEFMEHLIRTKGYTCIKYWTLANEPNAELHIQEDYSFEHYTRLHQAVHDEFKRRNLDIAIVGSDDSNSVRWFTQCVEDPAYYSVTDVYCSHRYFYSSELGLINPFFESRMPLLRAKHPVKPFIVGEFGFLAESWDSHINPLVKTYDYALLTSQFCIECLNHGAAGASIWVIQAMYYIDDRMMQFGLWEHAEGEWEIRPAYHAIAMFTRMTNTGDTVRRVGSTHPRRLPAACANDTLFWVNLGDQPAEVHVKGMPVRHVRIMTEDTLRGDRECGRLLPVSDGRFQAPPRSFGFCTTAQ